MVAARGAPATQSQSHILSAGVRKTIQSIKEIVGNFSDSDIYMALKEYNMDPNETTQRLLHQDPYHEVKSRRDKRKESMGQRGPVDTIKKSENVGQGIRNRPFSDRNARQGIQTRTAAHDNAGTDREFRNAGTDREFRNAGTNREFRSAGTNREFRNAGTNREFRNTGTNREFRVVRDNRVNQNTAKEPKLVLQQGSAPSNENHLAVVTEKGSSGTTSGNRRSGARTPNGPSDAQSRHTRDSISNSTERKAPFDEKRAVTPNASARVQAIKSNLLPPSNSVVGVYSSSTDPVHVPSPESRPSAAVGAIKREVGVVGGRRQAHETAAKNTSTSSASSSLANAVLGRDGSLSEPFRPFLAVSKSDEVSQTVATEAAMPNMTVSRSILSNQYSRPHQAAVGHQKAAQHNKEWKPKTNQKTSVASPGVIGTPTKTNSPQADKAKDLESGTTELQDKLSRVNIYEHQNVIIAQHIRVPETDRGRLTFGSFGVDFDSTRNVATGFQAVGVAEESLAESTSSLSVSPPESSNDDASANKQAELIDEQVRSSESDLPAGSGVVSEHQLAEKSPSPSDLDNYADIGLVQHESPSSYAPPSQQQQQQQQDPPELSNFSAYDPQTGYDMSYFRPTIDEAVRGQGLPSPHEGLASHTANNMPSSTIPIQQHQQPPMTQMYPQVHVSHFANLMPYRQFLSPVYVPQMAMPGYSSNPGYPHPSNGNSYLLMPGGSSHLGANGLKYGIQQFKPVPGGSPTGYGNFTSPSGYTMNAPGVVGGAAGLEDSSRIKYKDGNIYVPNPQAETSEIWVQNARELQGLQSAPYYNLAGQTPHGPYMPSHTGHTSFNGAPQSSHMQFPGLYPPPPPTPAGMANPHHMGPPVMGGNVGVGVAPAAPGGQVGAYQQPRLGHFNWTTNF